MSPIILSWARAQSKEAQRTGCSSLEKDTQLTLSQGDPKPVKKQVTLNSPASSPHSPSSSEAQFPALSQDRVRSPARPPA